MAETNGLLNRRTPKGTEGSNPSVSARAPSAGVLRRPVGLTYPYENRHFCSVAARRRSQPSDHLYGMIYGFSAPGHGTLRRTDHAYRYQDSCLETGRKAL